MPRWRPDPDEEDDEWGGESPGQSAEGSEAAMRREVDAVILDLKPYYALVVLVRYRPGRAYLVKRWH